MTDLFFLPQTWNKTTKVRLALLYEWGVYLLVVFFSVNTDSAWLFHRWVPSVFKRLFVVIVELSPLSSAIIPGLEKNTILQLSFCSFHRNLLSNFNQVLWDILAFENKAVIVSNKFLILHSHTNTQTQHREMTVHWVIFAFSLRLFLCFCLRYLCFKHWLFH